MGETARNGEALTSRHCESCKPGTPRLDEVAIAGLRDEVSGWSVEGAQFLRREYSFPNFRTALAWVNAISWLAEREGHHPDLSFGWGSVKVTLTTHSIGGLSENDFILAAKIDALSSLSPTK